MNPGLPPFQKLQWALAAKLRLLGPAPAGNDRAARVTAAKIAAKAERFLQEHFHPDEIERFRKFRGGAAQDWETPDSSGPAPTEIDVLRIRHLVRFWVSYEADREDITARLLELKDVLTKFKPTESVRVYRNEKLEGEDGWKEQYDFASAWSLDLYDAKVFGDVDRRLVTAIAQPEDILVSIPMVEAWAQAYELGPVDVEKADEVVIIPHPSFEKSREEIPADTDPEAEEKQGLWEPVVDAWRAEDGELPPNALAEAAKLVDGLEPGQVPDLEEKLKTLPKAKEKIASIDTTKAWARMVADRGPEFAAEIAERAQSYGKTASMGDISPEEWAAMTDQGTTVDSTNRGGEGGDAFRKRMGLSPKTASYGNRPDGHLNNLCPQCGGRSICRCMNRYHEQFPGGVVPESHEVCWHCNGGPEKAMKLIMEQSTPTPKHAKLLQPKLAALPALAPILQEFLSFLDPEGKCTVPPIKYVSNSSNTLGMCLTSSLNTNNGIVTGANAEITIQKGLAVDLNHLRKVVAHEVCHHVALCAMVLGKPLKEAQEALSKIGDGHGPAWQTEAQRINERYGADFVTKLSDMSSQEWEARSAYLFIMEIPSRPRPVYCWAPTVSSTLIMTMNEYVKESSAKAYVVKTKNRFMTQPAAKAPKWTSPITQQEAEALQEAIKSAQGGGDLFPEFMAGERKPRQAPERPWTLIMVNPKRGATGEPAVVNAWALGRKLNDQELEELKRVREAGREFRRATMPGTDDLRDSLPKLNMNDVVYNPGLISQDVQQVQTYLKRLWNNTVAGRTSKLLQPKVAALPGFHSALAQVIPSIKQIADKSGNVDPQQAIAWLQARQREGKFKKEEQDAVGVETAIAQWAQAHPSTRLPVATIVEFVAKGAVDVEPNVSGVDYWFYGTDGTTHRFNNLREAQEAFQAELDWVQDEAARIYDNSSDRSNPSIKVYDASGECTLFLYPATEQNGELPDDPNAWVWGYFEEPGYSGSPEDSTEVGDREAAMEFAEEEAEKLREHWRKEMSRNIEEGNDTEVTKYNKYVQPGGHDYKEHKLVLNRNSEHQFESAHWDEANVLAHTRTTHRETQDGTPVLFVEEIQSDWGQQGKQKGFGSVEIPDAPFVKDTKSWVSLALRYLIRYAAENNYTKLAFASGQQNADNYDLTKVVGGVYYAPSAAGVGKGTLIAMPPGTGLHTPGAKAVLTEDNVGPDEIEKYVGKEVTKRLLETPADTDGFHKVEGVDLKVGGEGMRVFYDQIIPQIAASILKRLGAGPLQEIPLQTRGGGRNAPWVPQLGFDITPALGQKVMSESQPLFASRKRAKLLQPKRASTPVDVPPSLIAELTDDIMAITAHASIGVSWANHAIRWSKDVTDVVRAEWINNTPGFTKLILGVTLGPATAPDRVVSRAVYNTNTHSLEVAWFGLTPDSITDIPGEIRARNYTMVSHELVHVLQYAFKEVVPQHVMDPYSHDEAKAYSLTMCDALIAAMEENHGLTLEAFLTKDPEWIRLRSCFGRYGQNRIKQDLFWTYHAFHRRLDERAASEPGGERTPKGDDADGATPARTSTEKNKGLRAKLLQPKLAAPVMLPSSLVKDLAYVQGIPDRENYQVRPGPAPSPSSDTPSRGRTSRATDSRSAGVGGVHLCGAARRGDGDPGAKLLQPKIATLPTLESPEIQQLLRTATISQLVNYDWDKIAFGFSSGDVVTLPLASIKIKYRGDMLNVNGYDMAAYFGHKPFDDLPPMEVSFEKGQFWLEDGHHRYGYARQLRLKEVPVFVEVKDNPFRTLGFDIDDVVRAKKRLEEAPRTASIEGKLYIDLDGVLADYNRGAEKAGVPPEEFLNVPGAFRHLELMPGAKEAVAELLRLAPGRVFICSKPSKDRFTASCREKRAWVAEHFPAIPQDHVLLVLDKSKVVKHGDFIVDDHPRWGGIEDFPGTILYEGPQTWKKVYTLLEQEEQDLPLAVNE